MEEIWKDITGYEGIYQVSSIGRIKSFPVVSKNNRQYKGERILRLNIKRQNPKHPIPTVTLCKYKTTKRFSVHRLVAKEFVLNPDNKPDVNHIDGDPLNNKVTNLEWCTKSENTIHAYRILKVRHPMTGKIGKLSPVAKPIVQFDFDMNPVKEWECEAQITREFGASRGYVGLACKGKIESAFGFIWKYKNNSAIPV